MFGVEKIPLMDEEGKLFYENDGIPTALFRVGGGFIKGSNNGSIDGKSPRGSPRRTSILSQNSGGSSPRVR